MPHPVPSATVFLEMIRKSSRLPQLHSASLEKRRACSRADVWLRSAHRIAGLLGAALVLALSARAPGATHDTAADWRAETAVLPAQALHSTVLSRSLADARDARRGAPPLDAPTVVDTAIAQPAIRVSASRFSFDRVGPRRAALARGYEATAPPPTLR